MAVSTAMDGEEPFYNVDVNANGVGLITDCTGDSDATAGMSGSADMRVEPDLEKTGCTSASTLQPHRVPALLARDRERFYRIALQVTVIQD